MLSYCVTEGSEEGCCDVSGGYVQEPPISHDLLALHEEGQRTSNDVTVPMLSHTIAWLSLLGALPRHKAACV